MDRMKGILAAGTLTGIILITVLVLGFGNLQALNDNTAVPPTVVVNPIAMPDGTVSLTAAQTGAQDTQALQAYAQQLESALQTMQSREAAYQAQINTANQTVVQLQDQLNAQTAVQPQAVSFNNNQTAPVTFSEHEHDD
ncbi:MAG: hypothetical protein IPF56_13870 [Chloroflexi bacterium]|nr:hypothetical protein [Chloroflexota bacterium]